MRSAAQVALEAGNSPQMIFERYRELVAEKAAKSWFAFTPQAARAMREKLEREREAKMVEFPAAGVALGRLGGLRGGKARAATMTAAERDCEKGGGWVRCELLNSEVLTLPMLPS